MKAKITRETTVNGKDVKVGAIVEVDKVAFQTLKSQGQAELYVEPAETEKPKK